MADFSIPQNDSNKQVNNPQDWRKIDTSTHDGKRALDVLIAKRAGYTVELVKPAPMVDMFYLAKGGQRFTFCWTINENQTWLSFVPRYSTDANAALELFVETDYHCELEYVSEGRYRWSAWIDDYSETWREEAETPALAICLCWLAHTDAAARQQDAEGGE